MDGGKITLEAWQWYLLTSGAGGIILLFAGAVLRHLLEATLRGKGNGNSSQAVKTAQECKTCRAEITAERDFAISALRKEIQDGFNRIHDRIDRLIEGRKDD